MRPVGDKNSHMDRRMEEQTEKRMDMTKAVGVSAAKWTSLKYFHSFNRKKWICSIDIDIKDELFNWRTKFLATSLIKGINSYIAHQ